MERIIKTSFYTYLYVSVFMGIWILLFLKGMGEKFAGVRYGKTIKISVACLLAGLWFWYFICNNLYPVGMAYYEYVNDLYSEKICVVESILQKGKDRIILVSEGIEYIIIPSRAGYFYYFESDADEGDTVTIRYGEKSRFVFEIYDEI